MSDHACTLCDGRGSGHAARATAFMDIYSASMAQMHGSDPVATLRESYARGRIELTEFERRVETVLRALAA